MFQSTRPVKGATSMMRLQWPWRFEFQSTRPVKGATANATIKADFGDVSIHAPREGRDPSAWGAAFAIEDVSIHAPREGRDGVHHNRLLKNGRIRHFARNLHRH